MNRLFACILLLGAAAAASGCRLERKQDLRDQENLIARRDNSEAARKTLIEEIERERRHLIAAEDEIARLRGEEEVLSQELASERASRDVIKKSLDEIRGSRAAIDLELKQEQDLKAGTEAALAAAKTPQERASLEARIAALAAEIERLKTIVAALPAG